MKVFAAVDIRGGAAVQLVGGDPARERVRQSDPVAAARRWIAAGFERIHVVDLDAALGHGANARAVADIAALATTECQVGGGVRSQTSVQALLEIGADRVVVGTRAVEDRPWLEDAAAQWPGRLVVAADVRGGRVVTHGWTQSSGRTARAFVAGLSDVPLGGILVTDVGREGRQAGVDADLFRELAGAAGHPLLAAGGVAGPEDLEALDGAGVAGVVLGMALYTGRLRPADALAWEETG